MGTVALALLVIGLALAVVLAAGTTFLQGYFYTEPNFGALWQAPLAAAAVVAFLFFWCWQDATDPSSRPGYVPYDTLLQFNPKILLTPRPVKTFETIRRGGQRQVYERHDIPTGAGPSVAEYYQKGQTNLKGPRWTARDAEAIVIEHDGQTYRFEPRKGDDNDYDYFISPEGWVMMQYEGGVTGQPYRFSFWLLTANLFFNLFHLVLWFVFLWLLLRFEWAHALGLALVLWGVLTVLVLPQLLAQAASVATPQLV